MMIEGSPNAEELAREVRLYILRQAAETARVPQLDQIAAAIQRPQAEVTSAVKALATGKVLVLAPHEGNIWIAPPFCAVPTGFRVQAANRTYWGICIWDALGICAALGEDGVVSTQCGDCGEEMRIEVRGGDLARSEGVIHFAVPARHWWDNIGFT